MYYFFFFFFFFNSSGRLLLGLIQQTNYSTWAISLYSDDLLAFALQSTLNSLEKLFFDGIFTWLFDLC